MNLIKVIFFVLLTGCSSVPTVHKLAANAPQSQEYTGPEFYISSIFKDLKGIIHIYVCSEAHEFTGYKEQQRGGKVEIEAVECHEI